MTLVWDRHESVWFYAGNDLLARPAAVPEASAEAVGMGASGPGDDLWIQAKSGDSAWTKLAVCRETLVNFGLNALLSRAQGRSYRVALATEGPIRGDDIRAFLANPDEHAETKAAFDEAVGVIVAQWQEHAMAAVGDQVALPTAEQVAALCGDIMGEVARQNPILLDLLLTRIEADLVEQHGTRELARGMIQKLLGALLDLAARSGDPLELTPTWLDEAVGQHVLPSGLLDHNVPRACDEQILRFAQRLPEWDAAHAVAQAELEVALGQFFESDAAVFVLSGSTDAGKTWALVQMSLGLLGGCVRCISGPCYTDGEQELHDLLYRAVSDWSLSGRDPRALMRYWVAAAAHSAAPPVLIVDDLRAVDGRPQAVQHQVARWAQSARDSGIKLVISVNDTVLSSSNLMAQTTEAMIWEAHGPLKTSFVLSGLSIDGLRQLADTYAGDEEVEGIVAEMAGRLESAISARVGGILCRSLGGGDKTAAQASADEMIEAEASRRLAHVSALAGIPLEEGEHAIPEVLSFVWRHEPQGIGKTALLAKLNDVVGVPYSNPTLLGLQEQGLISRMPTYALVQSELAGALIARWISRQEDLAWVDGLSGQALGEPIVRCVAQQDAQLLELCQRVAATGPELAGAACLGIARRTNVAIPHVGFLIGMTRHREGRSIAFFPACEALGRVVAKSDFARRRLREMFNDDNASVRYRGEIAVGYSFLVDREWASQQVRQRLAHVQQRTFSKSELRVKALRGVAQALQFVPYPAAMDNVRELIQELGADPEAVDAASDILASLRGRWEVL
jgi:hypothetical protein